MKKLRRKKKLEMNASWNYNPIHFTTNQFMLRRTDTSHCLLVKYFEKNPQKKIIMKYLQFHSQTGIISFTNRDHFIHKQGSFKKTQGTSN